MRLHQKVNVYALCASLQEVIDFDVLVVDVTIPMYEAMSLLVFEITLVLGSRILSKI
jgi:hypothetical protein